MTDKREHKAQAASETGTPADFLANLGKALREKENVDVDLVDVLATHVLTAAPTVDAINKAKVAILKLADDRANPPKPETPRG